MEDKPECSSTGSEFRDNVLIGAIYTLYICSWIVSGVTVGLLRWIGKQLGVSLAAVCWALSAWFVAVGWVAWKLWLLWSVAPSFSAFCGMVCL